MAEYDNFFTAFVSRILINEPGAKQAKNYLQVWRQNGQQGPERDETFGYWVLQRSFGKQAFGSEHSLYEKQRQQ